MVTLTLNQKEVEVLKKSINYCLDTCKKGGVQNGCTDCAVLEDVLHKMPDVTM